MARKADEKQTEGLGDFEDTGPEARELSDIDLEAKIAEMGEPELSDIDLEAKIAEMGEPGLSDINLEAKIAEMTEPELSDIDLEAKIAEMAEDEYPDGESFDRAQEMSADAGVKAAANGSGEFWNSNSMEGELIDFTQQQGRQAAPEFTKEVNEGGQFGDELKSTGPGERSRPASERQSIKGRASGVSPEEAGFETVSLEDGPTAKSGEKATGSKNGPTGKSGEKATGSKKGGMAGFLQTVREVWANTKFKLGPARGSASDGGVAAAEAKVEAKGVKSGVQGVERAAGKGAKAGYEYNQVVLVGFAEEFKRPTMQRNFEKWKSNPNVDLREVEGTSFKNPPIKFSGGQSIEVSKNGDVVMRGFTEDIYRSFNKDVLNSKPPTYRVSATNSNAYNLLNDAMGDDGKRSIVSVLTSAGLFFQKQWSDLKNWISGTASTAVEDRRPTSDKVKAEVEAALRDIFDDEKESLDQDKNQSPARGATQERKSFAEVSESLSESELPQYGDVPLETLSSSATSAAVEKGVEAPLSANSPVSQPQSQSDDQKERPVMQRQETSPNVLSQLDEKLNQIFEPESPVAKAPPIPPKPTQPIPRPAGLKQTWMCVRVSVEQKPDFEALKSSLDRHANDNQLQPVLYTLNDKEFSAMINDPSKGKISVKASKEGNAVEIKEVSSSPSSLSNMAKIVMALPPEGESKKYSLSGPTKRQDEFRSRLDAVEKKETPTMSRGSSKE